MNAAQKQGSPLRAQRGFALLITVTLLAFVVILLMGLAAYTRIETAIASNTQRQAQARENAMMALNVALGQLQKYAGPDTRVTATAQSFGSVNGTHPYTGVWSSDPNATTTPATPLTWLVSGNEFTKPNTTEGAAEGATVQAPLAVTPDAAGATLTALVGPNTAGAASANWVNAPLVDIRTTGVPGTSTTTATTIGRYAWWVGDQGVKAPVALADPSGTVDFAPYDSAELRSRIRQQIALGAGAATNGAAAFEPRDTNNASLVADHKIATFNQLAFVRNTSNAALGITRVQQNFHAWSPNNFAVIANTKEGGLRQDLSLKPDLLGVPFTAWANYASYMEKVKPDPVVDTPTGGDGTTTTTPPTPASTAPAISPAYGNDPVRRRYVMTPHNRTGNTGGSHQVGPVLTYFLLSFNVRTEAGAAGTHPLEVRARWMLSLWNPYTSSLVPEALQADITGLPTVAVIDDKDDIPRRAATIPLQGAFGSPLRINLPWTSDEGGAPDRQSWLPGRVYTWNSADDTTKSSSPPTDGYASKFYAQKFDDAAAGVQRPVGGSSVESTDPFHLEGNAVAASQLRIRLYVVRADGTRLQLGDFRAPPFAAFTTKPLDLTKGDYQFSYVFRLAESIDTPTAPGTWLTAPSRDPRISRLTPEFFVLGENGDDPSLYGDNYQKIESPSRLFDRAADSLTYNEDVPLFELPRGPILSMGALQHFRITGSRPFMIGNPWGVAATLNGNPLGTLFDRFYFSGVADAIIPTTNTTGNLVFPNPLLTALRKADGTKVTVDEFRATATVAPPPETTGDGTEPEPPENTPTDTTTTPPDQTDARSSKFLLQAGAFNLNSVNASAWAAVLRSVRFPAPQAFGFLDVSSSTGTAGDDAAATLATAEAENAQFFRFSQSAQETYKAEPGLSATGGSADATTPPNTHLFRKGMRTLTSAQVVALADKIVELIKVKQAAADLAGGPYRSLEEFLSPSSLFAGAADADGNLGPSRSLLEAAIADAGTNAEIAEFSSQWLTQADIMTALAPVLYARSDTFIIRTYGEAVNPATNTTEGRAWCEAIVQRLPDYVVTSDAPETMPSAFDAPSNPDDATSSPTKAHQLNKLLGRRFKVVSFRWLTRSDI